VVGERIAAGSTRFRVTLDDKILEVDAVRTDPASLSLIFPGRGTSHAVTLQEGAAGDLTVLSPDGVVPVTVNGRRARRGGDAGGAKGVQRVLAPMPGKVLRVLVRPGDDVTHRQPLLVIEAMKMENELSSPKAGRIAEIGVSEGMSVEAGRLLVIVE